MAELPRTDVVIKAAAVADYRPLRQAEHKIKKKDEALTLELVRNPDILQAIGEWKQAQPGGRGPVIVGFAAETNDLEHHALDKLNRKKCDFVVANDVSQAGAGFGVDTNIVSVYGSDGFAEQWPRLSKKDVARKVLELAAKKFGADPA